MTTYQVNRILPAPENIDQGTLLSYDEIYPALASKVTTKIFLLFFGDFKVRNLRTLECLSYKAMSAGSFAQRTSAEHNTRRNRDENYIYLASV